MIILKTSASTSNSFNCIIVRLAFFFYRSSSQTFNVSCVRKKFELEDHSNEEMQSVTESDIRF